MLVVFSVCLLAAAGVAAPAARADGVASGADLSVAQSLGDRELTVIVRRAMPGPLRVDVITHQGTAAGTLTLTARPVDRGGETSSATVELAARAGPYPATMRVDHSGPWELSVSDGEHTARIPFLVAARVVTPWERAAYYGFFSAGALVLVTLGVALISRRGWPTLVPMGALIVTLTVAVTGALLSPTAPSPRAPGSLLDPTSDNIDNPYPERELPLTTNYSRPPVNMTVHAKEPTAPGDRTDVLLALTDSATGRPVDDLLVNDDALLHLMVVGPSGRLWHRHPIRTAPGEYRISLDLTGSGEYAVAAEIARRGGGVQLLRSSLRVNQAAGIADPAPPSTTLTTTDPIASEPTTLAADFGGAADLQPWLGMLGHLIAVGPLPENGPVGAAAITAPIWAHAHAMIPTPPAGSQPPDETVATFGPKVAFTFTFPLPGRYLVWAQAERGYSVLTVPATVDVRTRAAQ